eukprot:60507_1
MMQNSSIITSISVWCLWHCQCIQMLLIHLVLLLEVVAMMLRRLLDNIFGGGHKGLHRLNDANYFCFCCVFHRQSSLVSSFYYTFICSLPSSNDRRDAMPQLL